MKRNSGALPRLVSLVLLALGMLVLSTPASANPRRVVVRRGGRVAVVNVHHRPGFWRGVAVGAAVATLPAGHVTVAVDGTRYHYYGGVYYRPAATGYVVVHPPVGAVIAAVPEGCVAASFAGAGYHYCAGTYYAPAPGGFAVVAAPIGIEVDELPIGCEETVSFDSAEHYSCSGIYYRPVVRSGATYYVTVKH